MNVYGWAIVLFRDIGITTAIQLVRAPLVRRPAGRSQPPHGGRVEHGVVALRVHTPIPVKKKKNDMARHDMTLLVWPGVA